VTADLSNYSAVRTYLYGLKHHGAKYGIDRMRLLASLLGNPERHIPIIHVAGTNGKGSVSAMLERIYRAHGYKTGLYTSPHLIRQGERIQIDRQLIEEDEIVTLTRELQTHAEALAAIDPDDHPSFFEFMTAMAFLKFMREKVDIGIIETGLGGRLDATNIVIPELSVITSISLDHVDILGDTIEKIAREKAGIIKPEVPVVMGKLPTEAEAVIREVAARQGSPIYSLVERWGNTLEDYPETNLAGSFQRYNAGMALLAAEILHGGFPVEPFRSREALRQVYWPGRWQQVYLKDRSLVLDATHNPEGCMILEENLRALMEKTGRKPDIIVGTLGEFRAQCLMRTVSRFAGNLYLVKPSQPRAASMDVLESHVPPEFSGKVIHASVRDLFPSPGICTVAGTGANPLVVTGSIYLIGEISDRLFREVPAEEEILQDPI